MEIEREVGRHAVPLALTQVDRQQGGGKPRAGVAVDRVLQPGERRLAGAISARLGQAPADKIEERVGAEGVGVVLVRIAAGDLDHALAHQRLQRMANLAPPPLGHSGGGGGTQAERRRGFGQPGQAAQASG